jgi:hypothetical protein
MARATEKRVIFNREWEMPNSRTYSIRCIERIIRKYCTPELFSIDPFANESRLATVTNDLNPEYPTDHHLDAADFLKLFGKDSVDVVLFDPPYSPRQVAECYKALGQTVNFETTQASFWTNMKNQIAHIVRPNGYVLCFGWNTNGIGQTLGFELVEVLLVAHGGAHNDTIVTVERKIQSKLF